MIFYAVEGEEEGMSHASHRTSEMPRKKQAAKACYKNLEIAHGALGKGVQYAQSTHEEGGADYHISR